jgi:hypothetical protein
VIIVAAMLLASASAGIVIAAASLSPITSSEGVRKVSCNLAAVDFASRTLETRQFGPITLKNGSYLQNDNMGNPDWRFRLLPNSLLYRFGSDTVRIINLEADHLGSSGGWRIVLGYVCSKRRVKKVLEQSSLSPPVISQNGAILSVTVWKTYEGGSPPQGKTTTRFRWANGTFSRIASGGTGTTDSTRVTVISAYVDDADAGNVHFLFSDGDEFTPPKNLTNSQGRQVGADSARIASDWQTIGWLATFPNCCTSYPIPMALVSYKLRHPVRKIESDQMIWRWMFVAGGSEVAFVQGPTHGTDIGDYKLCDTKTSKLLSNLYGPLSDNSPKWAKALDAEK